MQVNNDYVSGNMVDIVCEADEVDLETKHGGEVRVVVCQEDGSNAIFFLSFGVHNGKAVARLARREKKGKQAVVKTLQSGFENVRN